MLFGERLKMLRDEKGINQEEFAKIIGKSRSSVAGYEVNDRVPDSKTLVCIADYFNCTLDYLFGRSNYKNETEKELVNILSEKLSVPVDSIKQIMPLFNQFLDIISRSNSIGLIKELEHVIEWLYNHICQSLEDVDLEQKWIDAIKSDNHELAKSRETEIRKNISNRYYLKRFNESLDNYIDSLRENYREKLMAKLYKEKEQPSK